MNNSSPFSNYHNDILSANPQSADGKTSLVSEIKERSKNAIKYKKFDEALFLYSKALEILSTLDSSNKESGIIHGNMAMCYHSMGKYNDAVSNGKSAITLDSTYVKGYYRIAVACIALKNYDEAREYLIKGLEIEPDNKEMLEQMNICSKFSTTSPTTTTTTTTSSSSVSTSKNSSSSTAATLNTTPKVKEDKEVIPIDDPNEKIRGYKLKSDGRKTTFFDHELDEKTKELIGDIAPKKIEVAPALPVNNLGSAWNTAGTFESTMHTPFSKNRITELLLSLVDHPINTEYSITIKEILELSGDAEITVLRSKRKHIYDFTCKCSITVTSNGQHVSDGEAVINDITADGEYELSTFSLTNKSINQSSIKGPFSKKVFELLKKFDEEFKLK